MANDIVVEEENIRIYQDLPYIFMEPESAIFADVFVTHQSRQIDLVIENVA